MDLYCVSERIGFGIPDVFQQFLLTNDFPGMTHEVFQNGEFFAREFKPMLPVPDCFRGGIKFEITALKERIPHP